MRLLSQLVVGAIALGGVAIAAPLAGQPAAGAARQLVGDLAFEVPPGYVQQRGGGLVIPPPAPVSERTPCIYGLAPPRATTGNLEADAEAALVQTVVPGWRRLDDRHAAMRGVAAAGWS